MLFRGLEIIVMKVLSFEGKGNYILLCLGELFSKGLEMGRKNDLISPVSLAIFWVFIIILGMGCSLEV